MGHRPRLADSKPVIGRSPRVENAWPGLGQFGMCGGAGTEREIAHLVSGQQTETDHGPFRPRKFHIFSPRKRKCSTMPMDHQKGDKG